MREGAVPAALAFDHDDSRYPDPLPSSPSLSHVRCLFCDAAAQPTPPLREFPHEILVHIFGFLSYRAVVMRATPVSKRWSSAGRAPSLWKEIMLRFYHRALAGDPFVMKDPPAVNPLQCCRPLSASTCAVFGTPKKQRTSTRTGSARSICPPTPSSTPVAEAADPDLLQQFVSDNPEVMEEVEENGWLHTFRERALQMAQSFHPLPSPSSSTVKLCNRRLTAWKTQTATETIRGMLAHVSGWGYLEVRIDAFKNFGAPIGVGIVDKERFVADFPLGCYHGSYAYYISGTSGTIGGSTLTPVVQDGDHIGVALILPPNALEGSAVFFRNRTAVGRPVRLWAASWHLAVSLAYSGDRVTIIPHSTIPPDVLHQAEALLSKSGSG